MKYKSKSGKLKHKHRDHPSSHKKDVYVTNIVSKSKNKPIEKKPIDMTMLTLSIYGKLGKIFPATQSKQRNTHSSFATFHTGSLINTGSKSEARSLLAITLYEYATCNTFSKYIRILDWTVNNIVVSCSLGYELDMDKMNNWYGSINGGWRPDLFPGFTLKQDDLNVSFVVFVHGEVNITGLRSLDQIPIVEKRAHDLLYRCKKI